MAKVQSVFLTGVTGYIGGATLAHLLSAPATKEFNYAALVRSQAKYKLIESLGVRAVLGSYEDSPILASEAEKADIVIHMGNSADSMPACRAILEGMKRRNDKPILIHISGTGVLMDDARGEFSSDEIFSDLNPGHINKLPDSALHRNVDLAVLSASATDKVRTHIVLPSLVYGIADHELVRKGISNNLSIVVPYLIRASIARRQAGMIGQGMGLWPNVHISDIASAIAIVLEGAIGGRTATGREGYYFAESGEHKMYDISAEIARVLHSKGIGEPEPTPFTDDEVQKLLGGYYIFGANSRCRADRTRQLGWKTSRTTEDFIQSIGFEVEYILENEKAGD